MNQLIITRFRPEYISKIMDVIPNDVMNQVIQIYRRNQLQGIATYILILEFIVTYLTCLYQRRII